MNALSFNFSDNYWKLLENIVFIELYRKYWEKDTLSLKMREGKIRMTRSINLIPIIIFLHNNVFDLYQIYIFDRQFSWKINLFK